MGIDSTIRGVYITNTTCAQFVAILKTHTLFVSPSSYVCHTLAVCVSTTFLDTRSDLLPTSSLFTFSLA